MEKAITGNNFITFVKLTFNRNNFIHFYNRSFQNNFAVIICTSW